MPASTASPQDACVLGTLPEELRRAIASAAGSSSSSTNHFTAYLSTALPDEGEGTSEHLARCAAVPPTTPRFAVVGDTVGRRRWAVELCAADTPDKAGALAGTWQTNAAGATALGMDVAAATTPGAPGSVPITTARYCMLASTWRQTPLPASPPPTQRAVGSSAMAPPQKTSRHAADSAAIPTGEAHNSTSTITTTTAPAPSPSSSAAQTTTTTTAASRAASASPLHGASLQDLVQEHAALVRRLVLALAPQRQSAAQVMRTVCTTASTEGVSVGTGAEAPRVCEVEAAGTATAADAPNAGATRQYSEADVAAVIAVLTTPYPRQPQLRELRSEGFLLIDVDGFADGAARHKAVNRAYPALALHWPSSARLMDAMERYVDRDVVLETRKRHPELMQTPPSGRAADRHKRARSSSSASSGTSSRAASEGAAERTAMAASAHAGTPKTTAPRAGDDTSSGPLTRAASATSPAPAPSASPTAARLFHALREYPQSLEPGDLRAWAASAAAQQVRDCVAAATALADGSPTSDAPQSAAPLSVTTRAAAMSTAALSGLPISNSDDVSVLRGQYDGLAAGEAVLASRLRAYAETVQELRGWYRADLCAPSFQFELAAWVAGQEECRAALTNLLNRVHVLRYRLERDLSDFLHLHALGVV